MAKDDKVFLLTFEPMFIIFVPKFKNEMLWVFLETTMRRAGD